VAVARVLDGLLAARRVKFHLVIVVTTTDEQSLEIVVRAGRAVLAQILAGTALAAPPPFAQLARHGVPPDVGARMSVQTGGWKANNHC